jgi:ribosome-associated toxin RatA of RatAB toxin-antitoxin module
MQKTERSIEIAVSPERFLEVVQDYARYPEFLPDVKAIRVGKREGQSVEVTYWLDARIKVIELTLRHEQRGPREIAWKLVRGELMELDQGSWTLRETPRGHTHATYSIELRLAGRWPQSLERGLTDQGLPSMLANFKARAEKLFPPTR